jgi:hypothetical protein
MIVGNRCAALNQVLRALTASPAAGQVTTKRQFCTIHGGTCQSLPIKLAPEDLTPPGR